MNLGLLEFLLIGLIMIWPVCDFLAELHYRWLPEQGYVLKLKPSKFTMWLRGVRPFNPSEWFTKWTFKIFYDANHFFRNLPRILLTIILFAEHWVLGVAAIFFWALMRQLAFKAFIK